MDGEVKKKSLAKRMMLCIIPVTAVTIIAIVFFVVFNATNIVASVSNSALKQESEKDAAKISQQVMEAKDGMNSAVDAILSSGMTDNKQITKALKQTMNFSDLSTSGVYIGMEDGSWLDPSGWKPDKDYVITDRDWYKEGVSNDRFTLGEPYADTETGRIVVNMSRKVKLADGREGVAACDLKLDSIVKYVSKLKPMKSGGAMLLADDDILSYFHKEMNGKKIADANDEYLNKVKSIMDTHPSGVQSVKSYDGTTYECVFTAIDGSNWTLISSVDKDVVYSGLNRIVRLANIISIIGVIFISALLLVIIRKMISVPVRSLTDSIVKIAGGDFTKDEEEEDKTVVNDEIGQMSTAMDDFVGGMRETLTDIRNETRQLVSAAEKSENEAETMNTQAGQQSEAMEQISDTMNGMASAVTELAENATNLAEEVNSLADQGNATNDTVSSLLTKAEAGQKALSGVESEMGTLAQAMSNINDAVGKVGESASKITDIIDMIDSIAKQTNLLSLNASIEAARAGEAGKGFAVVASEIGKLAGDSSDAAAQIAAIIQEVTEKIQELAEQSSQNMVNIKSGTETVNNATATFGEIFTSLDETGNVVKSMIERVGKVNDIASSVAAIAEEQSASTEEVTATVDSVTATAQSVAESSKSVSDMAQGVNTSAGQIEEKIKRFRL